MRKDLYEEMYRLEESYWWHVAKRRAVKEFLSEFVAGFGSKNYLDVGCGTGKMMEEMAGWQKWQTVLGIDGADEALKYCRQRGFGDLIQADFETGLPIASGSVDVITSLDVVEHVKHDRALLQEFHRMLTAGGVVVITVPAHQKLWTYWDDVLGHKRRYSKEEMTGKLEAAGLTVLRQSYFYSYLLPGAVLVRRLKSRSKKWQRRSDFFRLPAVLNQVLLGLAKMESVWLQHGNIPIGLSVVCVAQKQR